MGARPRNELPSTSSVVQHATLRRQARPRGRSARAAAQPRALQQRAGERPWRLFRVPTSAEPRARDGFSSTKEEPKLIASFLSTESAPRTAARSSMNAPAMPGRRPWSQDVFSMSERTGNVRQRHNRARLFAYMAETDGDGSRCCQSVCEAASYAYATCGMGSDSSKRGAV